MCYQCSGYATYSKYSWCVKIALVYPETSSKVCRWLRVSSCVIQAPCTRKDNLDSVNRPHKSIHSCHDFMTTLFNGYLQLFQNTPQHLLLWVQIHKWRAVVWEEGFLSWRSHLNHNSSGQDSGSVAGTNKWHLSPSLMPSFQNDKQQQIWDTIYIVLYNKVLNIHWDLHHQAVCMIWCNVVGCVCSQVAFEWGQAHDGGCELAQGTLQVLALLGLQGHASSSIQCAGS